MKRIGLMSTMAVLAVFAVTGCTVQPLYNQQTASIADQPAALRSVEVAQVDSRVGVELRNRLIFLLNGGEGQPESPRYRLSVQVTSQSSSALVLQQSSRDGEPSKRDVSVAANYTLRNIEDDSIVTTRRVSVTASFDVSQQEFGNVRAERDAENRAAREAAEQIHALLAADLSRTE
ncbi:LPS assembly lipoprotein LptE [Oricola sp.]|uniref:LPS assembly lipoprotein LptE n=1 Tax=Oricola sp. TaxID=1979950 RepID=UPI003BABE987